MSKILGHSSAEHQAYSTQRSGDPSSRVIRHSRHRDHILTRGGIVTVTQQQGRKLIAAILDKLRARNKHPWMIR